MATAVYTLEDLENAIAYLNKTKTAKDIEDIYGSFNDPEFQAALKVVKGLSGELSRAVRLNNLVLLQNVLNKHLIVIKKALNQNNRFYRNKNLLYGRKVQGVYRLVNKGLGRFVDTPTKWVVAVLRDNMTLLNGQWSMNNPYKAAYMLREVLGRLEGTLTSEADIKKLDFWTREVDRFSHLLRRRLKLKAKIAVYKNVIAKTDSEIKVTLLAQTVNIMSNMWTMVLDNLYI